MNQRYVQRVITLALSSGRLESTWIIPLRVGGEGEEVNANLSRLI